MDATKADTMPIELSFYNANMDDDTFLFNDPTKEKFSYITLKPVK